MHQSDMSSRFRRFYRVRALKDHKHQAQPPHDLPNLIHLNTLATRHVHACCLAATPASIFKVLREQASHILRLSSQHCRQAKGLN